MTKNPQSMHVWLNKYDEDWIKLISEAKQSGFSLTEVRDFLRRNDHKEKVKNHHRL